MTQQYIGPDERAEIEREKAFKKMQKAKEDYHKKAEQEARASRKESDNDSSLF